LDPDGSEVPGLSVARHPQRIRGTHTLKFGGEWRRDRQIYLDNCCDRGAITFNGQYTDSGAAGVTDFLLGLPNFAGLTSVTFANKYQNGLNFFGQDTWRVNSKLTLNYGLRWGARPLLHFANQRDRQFQSHGKQQLGWAGPYSIPRQEAVRASGRRLILTTKPSRRASVWPIGSRVDLFSALGTASSNENYSRLGNESDLALNPPFYVDHEINFGREPAARDLAAATVSLPGSCLRSISPTPIT